MIGSQPARVAAVISLLGLLSVCPGAEPRTSATQKPAVSTEKRIEQLIAELGDEDFSIRQRAQDNLAKLGFEAFDALDAASRHDDFEIASRARYLLRWIRSQSSTESDPPEARKLAEGYELLQDDERRLRLARLIRLPNLGGIAVVCRLIRFERSPAVASHAAVDLLEYEPMDRESRARWARLVRENLAGTRSRPGCWLTSYLDLGDNPKATIATWANLVEEEARTQRTRPEQTARGTAPLLAYLLAEAHLRQGDEARAKEAAQRALELGGTSEPAQLRARTQTAFALKRRGLFAWAEAEYRRVADIGPAFDKVAALVFLSEMLHDRGESLSAAEARREAAESLSKLPAPERAQVNESLALFGIEPGDIRARMDYFLACHWAQKGDHAKQREHLKAAIQASSREVDTLIGLFRLPDQTPAERDATRKLIDRAVAVLRQEVEREDAEDDAGPFNQIAWLMGNTQTNLDEALRFAKKAVELSPDNGAYLDTLAHVHFAKGDLDNAVRVQARAAEVEPHSGLIVAELKAFRAAAEQRKKKG